MNMQNSVSYAFECELTMEFVTKGGRKYSHLIRSLFLKYKYFFAFFTYSLSRKTMLHVFGYPCSVFACFLLLLYNG